MISRLNSDPFQKRNFHGDPSIYEPGTVGNNGMTYLLNSLSDLSHGHDKIDVGNAVDFAQHDGDELSALHRLLFNDTRVVHRCAVTAHETWIARCCACTSS